MFFINKARPNALRCQLAGCGRKTASSTAPWKTRDLKNSKILISHLVVNLDLNKHFGAPKHTRKEKSYLSTAAFKHFLLFYELHAVWNFCATFPPNSRSQCVGAAFAAALPKNKNVSNNEARLSVSFPASTT